MSKAYIGIDPGATGAIALIYPDGRLGIWDIDSSINLAINALVGIAKTIPDIVAAIEHVGTMPGQGAASQGKFLQGAGMLKGALIALQVPIVAEPTPVAWKKLVGIAMNPPKPPRPLKQCTEVEKKAHRAALTAYKRDQKTVSRERAAELFPSHADKFSRAKDDGRAEAALIAEYCRRVGKS